MLTPYSKQSLEHSWPLTVTSVINRSIIMNAYPVAPKEKDKKKRKKRQKSINHSHSICVELSKHLDQAWHCPKSTSDAVEK
jgi:hypothetical protein